MRNLQICISYLNTPVLKFNPDSDNPGFGSHAVILDLEDGIHHSMKEAARDALAKFKLEDCRQKDLTFGLRINSLYTIEGIRDIGVVHSLCAAGGLKINFIQLPKVRSPHEVLLLKEIFQDINQQIDIIPIIEIPESIEKIDAIAAVSDAMMFGQVDMVTSMYQKNNAYMDYARGRFCVACARAGIMAIDTAGFNDSAEIKDLDAFEQECQRAKAEGFVAKAVIHPVQVPVVNKIFAIRANEIDQYRSVIRQYETGSHGFFLAKNTVVAPPFVSRAKMMLRLYGHEIC